MKLDEQHQRPQHRFHAHHHHHHHQSLSSHVPAVDFIVKEEEPTINTRPSLQRLAMMAGKGKGKAKGKEGPRASSDGSSSNSNRNFNNSGIGISISACSSSSSSDLDNELDDGVEDMMSLRDAILDVSDDIEDTDHYYHNDQNHHLHQKQNMSNNNSNSSSYNKKSTMSSSSSSSSVGESSSAASSFSNSYSSTSTSTSSPLVMQMQTQTQTHLQQDHDTKNRNDADTIAAAEVEPDESQWRKHGLKHRFRLLEDDRRKGGHDFKISPKDCTVQRYFQVAQVALEQFHALYQSGSKLEESYVMGHRIVSFLTECLPQHPGLYRSPDVRKRARAELELLQQCLEDVALQIDEDVCNQFVADFNPSLDDFDDDDDDDDEDSYNDSDSGNGSDLDEAETVKSSFQSQENIFYPASSSVNKINGTVAVQKKRVRFEDWPEPEEEENDHFMGDNSSSLRSVVSPSNDTVGTTGTGSFEAGDSNFFDVLDAPDDEKDDDGGEEQKSYNDHGSTNITSFPSYRLRSVELDFLERIAEEKVEYEDDSDADDSWAQTDKDDGRNDDSPYDSPPSSGDAPSCDPARLAFRNLMNRLPKEKHLLKSGSKLPSHGEVLTRQEQVDHELQRYLESDNESDASDAFDALRKKLREGSVSSNDSVCKSESIATSESESSSSTSSSKNGVLPSSLSSHSSSSTSVASSTEKSASSNESESTSTSSLSDSPRSAFHPYSGDHFKATMNMDAPDDEQSFRRRVEEENNFWEQQNDWIAFDAAPNNYFSSSKV